MRIPQRKLCLVPAMLAAGLLTGCLVPETFQIKVDLDGYKYHLTADGRIADARALAAIVKGQAITPQDEEAMATEAKATTDMPGFKHFEYVGQGRFDLAVDLAGSLERPDQAIGFPDTKAQKRSVNFISVERMEDGTIEVRSPKINTKMLQDLNQLGTKPTGALIVHTSEKVIETNADDKPGFFGGGDYSWNINSWDKSVFIKIDPRQP
jgi:hypothetical protein